MKIKTSELTGAALDWVVTKMEAERKVFTIYPQYITAYSTNWAQGGPIIEREGIGIQFVPAGTSQGWWAIKDSTFHDRSRPDETRGDTPLIAAMRCYVASKLGDEVEVPDELKGESK